MSEPPMGAMPNPMGMDATGPMGPGPDAGPASDSQVTPLGQDYREIIDHCLQVMQRERDDVDKAELAKVVAMLQRVLARNQSNADRAMGDSGLNSLMRKASGGGV